MRITPTDPGYGTIYSAWVSGGKAFRFTVGGITYLKIEDNSQIVFVITKTLEFKDYYYSDTWGKGGH